jgi:hypothetical protein
MAEGKRHAVVVRSSSRSREDLKAVPASTDTAETELDRVCLIVYSHTNVVQCSYSSYL